jgi:hypothetical protein
MKKDLVKIRQKYEKDIEEDVGGYNHLLKPWCWHCKFMDAIPFMISKNYYALEGYIECLKRECPYDILPLCKRCIKEGYECCNGEIHNIEKMIYSYSQYRGVIIPFNPECNYSKILGVEPGCKVDEIKKNYRELALQYHPDRAKEKDKKEYEEIFKAISYAYEVLMKQRGLK